MKKDTTDQPIHRIKNFAKGHARANFNRMFIFFCVPLAVFIASVLLFLNHNLYAGVIVWVFFPLSRFFMIGSLKSRLLNALPVLIGILYLMVGLETGEWETWMVLFFLVPFLSFLVKPKRHPLQYATLGLSLTFISIDYLTKIDIPVWWKWIVVTLIYVIFVPPLMKKRVNRFLGFHKEPPEQRDKGGNK